MKNERKRKRKRTRKSILQQVLLPKAYSDQPKKGIIDQKNPPIIENIIAFIIIAVFIALTLDLIALYL